MFVACCLYSCGLLCFCGSLDLLALLIAVLRFGYLSVVFIGLVDCFWAFDLGGFRLVLFSGCCGFDV